MWVQPILSNEKDAVAPLSCPTSWPLPWHTPFPNALLRTLVHGLLLLATVHGTGLGDSGRLLGTPQVRELTGLGEKVIEGVTEVGNVVLVEGPILPLSLAQTLHQLCRGQRKEEVRNEVPLPSALAQELLPYIYVPPLSLRSAPFSLSTRVLPEELREKGVRKSCNMIYYHPPENWECSMLDQFSRFTILKLSFSESMLEHQSGNAGKQGA